MIAFIGPVLYLTKGRKLIAAPDPEAPVAAAEAVHAKQYYIDLIGGLNLAVKLFVAGSIFIICFGYFVRIAGIYFFWESKQLGFALLSVSLLMILRKDIVTRKRLAMKNVLSHIGFWVIVFLLFVKAATMIVLVNTDAYIAARTYIEENRELKSETGDITSHTLLPGGSIQIISNAHGTHGAAAMNILIKGQKAFKEQTLFLNKTPEAGWKVMLVK